MACVAEKWCKNRTILGDALVDIAPHQSKNVLEIDAPMIWQHASWTERSTHEKNILQFVAPIALFMDVEYPDTVNFTV